jgi:hypothetical protein
MREVIGEVLPLAVVVMVSPINIVAAILLLFSSRPIGGATAYLLGFAAGESGCVRFRGRGSEPQEPRDGAGCVVGRRRGGAVEW